MATPLTPPLDRSWTSRKTRRGQRASHDAHMETDVATDQYAIEPIELSTVSSSLSSNGTTSRASTLTKDWHNLVGRPVIRPQKGLLYINKSLIQSTISPVTTTATSIVQTSFDISHDSWPSMGRSQHSDGDGQHFPLTQWSTAVKREPLQVIYCNT